MQILEREREREPGEEHRKHFAFAIIQTNIFFYRVLTTRPLLDLAAVEVIYVVD
jgi:hypothetical protein